MGRRGSDIAKTAAICGVVVEVACGWWLWVGRCARIPGRPFLSAPSSLLYLSLCPVRRLGECECCAAPASRLVVVVLSSLCLSPLLFSSRGVCDGRVSCFSSGRAHIHSRALFFNEIMIYSCKKYLVFCWGYSLINHHRCALSTIDKWRMVLLVMIKAHASLLSYVDGIEPVPLSILSEADVNTNWTRFGERLYQPAVESDWVDLVSYYLVNLSVLKINGRCYPQHTDPLFMHRTA